MADERLIKSLITFEETAASLRLLRSLGEIVVPAARVVFLPCDH
jgi:hypothetical protein